MTTLHGRLGMATALAATMFTPVAFSHVTLDTREAPTESHYKAVFRVPHGCKGSATVKLRVRIPEGVISVKPQPKPGWTVDTVDGDYAKTYTLYGATLSRGVQEIIWSGGPLLDKHYDEFTFMSFLSPSLKPNTTVYFPVVQECEQGVERWIDQPSTGQLNAGADDHAGSPAPGLKLLTPR